MVLISFLVAFATVMSAVGICDRCDIGSGGVYYILTHVLGGKVGATVGLLYSVGHVSILFYSSSYFSYLHYKCLFCFY